MPEEENVRVVVRIRPLSKKEVEKGCQVIAHANSSTRSIRVTNPSDDKTLTFSFDAVFQDASQAEIYNNIARPLVESVLEGYNATVFAYGQTGTGKTFTMEGEPTPELKGIIPNSFAQIFTSISKAPEDTRFLVRVSHLEIYNEEVRDLLSKQHEKKLEVKEASDRGVYVKDLSSYVVRNAADMDKIMEAGNRNRIVASTNMNAVSSRSHAIFTITVECSTELGASIEGKGRSIRMGKLNLVDLAGSERLSKTGATGKRLKEATKINWSLANLGNVISALVEGSSHVPYRNSKLTRLLQDSLGGNARTVMIANVGPADYNYDETVNTLRYAHRAKSIRNHASINEDPKDALLRQFENEIEELRRQLEETGGEGDMDTMRMPNNDPTAEEGEEDEETEEEPMPAEITDILIPPETEETLTNIKGEIETQEKITSSFGEVTKGKHEALNALKEHVRTWKEQEHMKKDLQERMKSIKKQILHGGENLLDKSQQQEQLLQQSLQELERKKLEEAELTTKLEAQKAETAETEQKIAGLQEQGHVLNKKLKKVWNQYHTAKTELEETRQNYQKETDSLLEDIQKMTKEVQYLSLIMDSYIPVQYQSVVEEQCIWNEDIGEWSLTGIAYAGNNFKRHSSETEEEEEESGRKVKSVDLSQVYLRTELDNVLDNPGTSSMTRHEEQRPVTRASLTSAAAKKRPQTSRPSMRW